MTKQEFESLVGKTIGIDDYRIIELVYEFHPSISETEGKKQIADLYKIGEMRIIQDMRPTALRAMDLEEKIMIKRLEMHTLQKELEDLKKGYTL